MLKNGHVFGSLQQAPQRLHLPLRLLSTGKTLVAVRLNLAGIAFFEKSFDPIPIINTELQNKHFLNLCNKTISEAVFIYVKSA
ncbi:MAG: hypothetical protein ACYS0C_09630 [Planctomycetota bacterium]|jgi:hypothetical protein